LLRGDEIFVAVQEERLTRVKRQWIYGAANSLAANYCLSFAGVQPRDLRAIALSVTGSARAPRPNLQLNPLVTSSGKSTRTFVVPHHYAHAVSTFATSGFADSAILVIDGVGSPAEAHQSLYIACKSRGNDLNGNFALQTCITRTIYFTHPARTER